MTIPRTSSAFLRRYHQQTARIFDILRHVWNVVPFPFMPLEFLFRRTPHTTHYECKCCRIVDCMFLFCFASEGHDMQTVMKSQPELHWGRSSLAFHAL